ncbi:DUF5819 family protein [Gulosibacter sp. ACHW.36C]|uniref:DUF5819 family protein n=1 Tax=Gulosibacter sediminis TaxID=1729695 RepID=A0ABY4MXF6_9MICO|nr:DUF5819 family protein [Gulosibacter sediminis]UQN15069.1 DUF5819 family protein [Gulosibacter sediminis]
MTTSETKKKRSPLVRVVLAVAALFTAWHVFASFLWIAPTSPMREVVPGNALSSYMIPFFGQSWSVFAPAPINGDYTFKVRAQVEGDDGELTETEWVDATAVELSMIQYNLFPPRAGIQSTQVASSYKGSFDDLNADHRVVVALNYFEDDFEQRLEDKLDEYGDENAVDAYMPTEHMATAYATQVAHAIWGDGVVRVQFEVTRQNVIPFEQRNDADATLPDPTILSPGWRGTVRNEGQSDEAFEEIFRDTYEGMQE